MKLEQQVCSLELSKKLKELGVKQESLFFYNSKTMELQKGFTSHTDRKGIHHWSISAFTVAELGEMLPKSICIYKKSKKKLRYKWLTGTFYHPYFYYPIENDKGYGFGLMYTTYVWFETQNDKDILHAELAHTEANVRAKMLIYLLENKLLSVPPQTK